MLSHLNLKVTKMNRIIVRLKRTQPPYWIPSEPAPQGALGQVMGGWVGGGAWVLELALFCGPCWAVAALCALCGPHVKELRSGELGPRKVHSQSGQLFLGISAHS